MQDALITMEQPRLANAGPLRGSRIHGEDHWRRVGANGHRLGTATPGADARIVLWFAMPHDCRCENNGRDPEHGPRAAALASDLAHGDPPPRPSGPRGADARPD